MIAFSASLAVFLIGVLIIWANPRRRVNIAVFSSSFHGAVWLASLGVTMQAEDGLLWLRVTCAIGALIPLNLWLVKECLAANIEGGLVIRLRRLVWATIPLALAIICFTEFFIPSHSTGANRVHGAGYFVFVAGSLVMYIFLLRDTYVRMKALSGVARLELQVWLLGGAGVAFSVVLLMGLNAWFHWPFLITIQPVVVLLFYAVTTYAITTSRLFDARSIVAFGLQRMLSLGVVSGLALAVYYVSVEFLVEPLAVVSSVLIALWAFGELNRLLVLRLNTFPRADAARSKALGIAMRETDFDRLRAEFEVVLQGWSQSDHCLLLTSHNSEFVADRVRLPIDSLEALTAMELRWVTPERLQRERMSEGRRRLMEWMEERQLAALVYCSGESLNLLVGVGHRLSRRPFTFPEVSQLVELSSIFQTSLARGLLWTHAQRADQLATVGLLGAGIAHEIRNPLVTIKSFVHLLPSHYSDESFRTKFFRLIGDEVARIDLLTEQLLNLAAPKRVVLKTVDVSEVVRNVLELSATQAARLGVVLCNDVGPGPINAFSDARALQQILLNLCLNGIQAQEALPRDKWLRVSVVTAANGVEICVVDNGPGIAKELRATMFQPFQSSKSSGFGLGLVVCRDIVAKIGAALSIDPFESGKGAVFRVLVPCQPHTS